jgi:hypothetical protein
MPLLIFFFFFFLPNAHWNLHDEKLHEMVNCILCANLLLDAILQSLENEAHTTLLSAMILLRLHS